MTSPEGTAMEHKSVIGQIRTQNDVVRFWGKVFVPQDHQRDCWQWTASLDVNGYGQFRIDRKTRKAHQISYEAMAGHPVPSGLELDHLCKNRTCVNPYHLEPVTHAENCARSARWNGTTCLRGHPWGTDNTITRPGGRECRTCRNAGKRRRHHEGRDA